MNSAHIPEIMDGRGNNDNVIKEESRCFVCDAEIQSRYYALATCRTQYSQTRAIEKLGELVGERYMVVISEDDVICRSCAILINTLDRLEMEIRNARDHVLRFLEKKYSLEDGELRGGSDRPKPCQPPQITKSNAKEISAYPTKENETDVETYLKSKEKKSRPWLQCDKCKYTTPLNSFMMYHLRDHIKQKKFYDKCGLHVLENQQDTRHNCINKSGNKETCKKDNSGAVRNDSMEIPFLEKQLTLPFIQTTPPPLIGLSNCDHLYISNVLSANDPVSSKQPMYILQPIDMVNVNDSRKMTRKSESNSVQETEINDRSENKRQALTLTEDGSLEMVEIACWNET